MRDGNGVLFYWPVVVRPDGVMQPLPSGEIVSLSKTDPVNITMNLSEDGDNEFYNIAGPDGGVSNIVIDPRAIPIAIERPYLEGETYLRDHVNLLEIKHFSGLFVGAYYGSDNKPIFNGPSTLHTETGAFVELENLVVTVGDLADKLRDCDGKAIVNRDTFTEFPNLSLATCANIQTLVQELRNVISSILEIQNRLETLEERPYDGSGATTDIAEGNANPGPGDDSALNVPYVIQTLSEVEERKEHTQITAVQYLQSTSLDSSKVYAIDFYRTRSTPQSSGQPLVEKEYQGTVYVRPNSFGQVSYRLGVATHASGVSGAMFGGGWVAKLVFRNLRQGEVATDVRVTPDA